MALVQTHACTKIWRSQNNTTGDLPDPFSAPTQKRERSGRANLVWRCQTLLERAFILAMTCTTDTPRTGQEILVDTYPRKYQLSRLIIMSSAEHLLPMCDLLRWRLDHVIIELHSTRVVTVLNRREDYKFSVSRYLII